MMKTNLKNFGALKYSQPKGNIWAQKYLYFRPGFSRQYFKEIVSLNSNKAAHSNGVPTKIVEANAELFALYLSRAYNDSVITETVSYVFTLADITRIHKKSNQG